jgi:hypothetical protein
MTDRTKVRNKASARAEIEGQEMDVGFIRLYILYRASIEPISIRGISEMLAHPGLTVSTHSICQFCLGLKNKGYLKYADGRGRQHQTLFCATRQGRRAVEQARGKLRWAG